MMFLLFSDFLFFRTRVFRAGTAFCRFLHLHFIESAIKSQCVSEKNFQKRMYLK